MPPEPAAGRRRLEVLRADARGFAGWFLRNRFVLMERLLPELEGEEQGGDRAELRRRFLRCTRHARRVMAARAFVTALLALGVVATALAAFGETVALPSLVAADVERGRTWLERAAAIAGSFTLVLLGLRLAFDRYLRLVETTATFLAMRIAALAGAPAPSAA